MKKIQIGLLVDNFEVPRWVYQMTEQIIKSDYADVSLIIVNEKFSTRRSLFQKLTHSPQTILYALYVRIDNFLFSSKKDAYEKINLLTLVNSVKAITVSPKTKGFSHRFEDTDLNKIRQENLDIILRIGFKILRGDILNACKYGIWSFHHGDNKFNRGGPPGVWEVLQGWDRTGVILQVLTEELDGGLVIEKIFSKTDHLSSYRNNNNSYWKSIPLILRNLKKMHMLGGDEFMKQVKSRNLNPFFYFNQLYITPTNFKLVGLLFKKTLRKIHERIYHLFYVDQWLLMYKISNHCKLSLSFFRFKRLTPPKDRFWSDPFIIFKDDVYHIFFEELIYKTNKGHISYLTIYPDGRHSESNMVLEKDYHLSYPFVTAYKDQYYMIPETYGNKRIELYKCTQFPDKWELVQILMDNILAVDSTVFYHNGKYWLFCNVQEIEGVSTLDELFIFYADELETKDWHPHARNPVISDVKKSRSAGKIFQFEGSFYRPSQDGSKHYGRGLHIGKIITLSETEYVEESIQYIYARWSPRLRSIHTINHEHKMTIVDAQMKRFKF